MVSNGLARLEASIEHIERDIAEIKSDVRSLRERMACDSRITWGGLIVFGLGLAGLMAKGFGWL